MQIYIYIYVCMYIYILYKFIKNTEFPLKSTMARSLLEIIEVLFNYVNYGPLVRRQRVDSCWFLGHLQISIYVCI